MFQIFYNYINIVVCLSILENCFSGCANINWAKRLKCNICNTNKPGVNKGSVGISNEPKHYLFKILFFF
ncbi:putative Zinc finger, RanBP2-type superfamily [Helianthus anomalus]